MSKVNLVEDKTKKSVHYQIEFVEKWDASKTKLPYDMNMLKHIFKVTVENGFKISLRFEDDDGEWQHLHIEGENDYRDYYFLHESMDYVKSELRKIKILNLV